MKILSLYLALFSFGAFAQSQDLNSMKQKANADINQRMDSLRTAKDCVGSANTMEKFKACKYDMHDHMKMQKMESMERKKVEKETLE